MSNYIKELKESISIIKENVKDDVIKKECVKINEIIQRISFYLSDKKLLDKKRYVEGLIRKCHYYETVYENEEIGEIEFRRELIEKAGDYYDYRGDLTLAMDNVYIEELLEYVENYISLNYSVVKNLFVLDLYEG